MHVYQTHQCIDRQFRFDVSSGALSISHGVTMLHIRPITGHGGVYEVGRETVSYTHLTLPTNREV